MDTEVLIIPANVIASLKEKNLYVRCFLYELATKRFSDVMWAMQQIMLMGHAYGVGAGTLRFGKEKFCQPPIQPLEHDLLHRPHHIRKPFRCQLIEEAADR